MLMKICNIYLFLLITKAYSSILEITNNFQKNIVIVIFVGKRTFLNMLGIFTLLMSLSFKSPFWLRA